MYGKKTGFTLLELMIVIGIIMVLMGITMRFGSSRIHDLDIQTTKEKFIHSYQQFTARVLNSNYYNDQRYAEVSLDFSSGGHSLLAVYPLFDTGVSLFDSSHVVFDSFLLSGVAVERVFLRFFPYQLGCSLLSKEAIGSGLSFRMRIDEKNQYCFSLQEPLCKLEQIACP